MLHRSASAHLKVHLTLFCGSARMDGWRHVTPCGSSPHSSARLTGHACHACHACAGAWH